MLLASRILCALLYMSRDQNEFEVQNHFIFPIERTMPVVSLVISRYFVGGRNRNIIFTLF